MFSFFSTGWHTLPPFCKNPHWKKNVCSSPSKFIPTNTCVLLFDGKKDHSTRSQCLKIPSSSDDSTLTKFLYFSWRKLISGKMEFFRITRQTTVPSEGVFLQLLHEEIQSQRMMLFAPSFLQSLVQPHSAVNKPSGEGGVAMAVRFKDFSMSCTTPLSIEAKNLTWPGSFQLKSESSKQPPELHKLDLDLRL